MTSHATVDVMLALEGEFDVEFPDELLKRSVFGSIASIRNALVAIGPLKQGQWGIASRLLLPIAARPLTRTGRSARLLRAQPWSRTSGRAMVSDRWPGYRGRSAAERWSLVA